MAALSSIPLGKVPTVKLSDTSASANIRALPFAILRPNVSSIIPPIYCRTLYTVIGRDIPGIFGSLPPAELSTISGRHCTIALELNRGVAAVTDLSTNGTFIGKCRIPIKDWRDREGRPTVGYLIPGSRLRLSNVCEYVLDIPIQGIERPFGGPVDFQNRYFVHTENGMIAEVNEAQLPCANVRMTGGHRVPMWLAPIPISAAPAQAGPICTPQHILSVIIPGLEKIPPRICEPAELLELADAAEKVFRTESTLLEVCAHSADQLRISGIRVVVRVPSFDLLLFSNLATQPEGSPA